MLVAADIAGRRVRQGEGTALRSANLAIYRVDADGRRPLATSIPVETGNLVQLWSGMMPL